MGKQLHTPMTMLYPVPAVLVSCGVERPNIITLAWAGTVCSAPPMVGIAVRPNRYSHALIRDQGQFVVNLPTADQVEVVDYCGTVSGRDEDKFAHCHLTASPSSQVAVPLIAECPLHLECAVRQIIPLGSHDLFLGEVVAIQVDDSILNDAGKVDWERAKLLCYVAQRYYAVGERLEVQGFSRR